jgi:hypothetical protein
MNYDKLEFKPAHEFWNEAKNELGYSWMDVYVEEYGDSTEFVLARFPNISKYWI